MKDATIQQLHQLAVILDAAGAPADMFYSGNLYLDLLPRGMNKGAAVSYLARSLNIAAQQVIVCGDSGNDLSMYLRGFCGVLVANAEAELVSQAAAPVYHSPLKYAAGVLDGIRHWSQTHGAAGL